MSEVKYKYTDELPVNVNELKERGIIGDAEVMVKDKEVLIDEKHKKVIKAMDICPLFEKIE